MPRPRIEIDEFREEIGQRLFDKQTHAQIAQALEEKEGISITARFIKDRCKEWGLSYRGLSSNATVLASISQEFHTTTNNDESIASTLNAHGLPISSRQVEAGRLSNGWRHCASNDEQMAVQRKHTFACVEALLKEGTIRY